MSPTYWFWLVVAIATLDYAGKFVLLKRQLHAIKCGGVPVELKPLITAEEFLFSAQRFQAKFYIDNAHACLYLLFVLGTLLSGFFAAVWNWCGNLVDQDKRHAEFLQGLAWVAAIQLSYMAPRLACFVTGHLCTSRTGPRATASTACFLDRTTICAAICLVVFILRGKQLSALSFLQYPSNIVVLDTLLSWILSIFITLPAIGIHWVSIRKSKLLGPESYALSAHLNRDQGRTRTFDTGGESGHTQLTSAEAEALAAHQRVETFGRLGHTLWLTTCFLVVIPFMHMFTGDATFLRAFGFGVIEEAAPARMTQPLRVVGTILAALVLRPLAIVLILLRNLLWQKKVEQQDIRYLRKGRCEVDPEPINDWVDYEGGDILSYSERKVKFVEALVKVYLANDLPLFSDPLFSIYFQTQPALCYRLATLNCNHPPSDTFPEKNFTQLPSSGPDESDSEIAVPSIMLQA